MDMYCARCGEPWDNDTFHDAAAELGKTYRDVVRDFQSRGCIAIGWQATECERQPSMRTEAMAAMFDLLGDDTDGAMAMMEDLEYTGMLD
jgi:methionine synthase II (cobalamin-independent)